MTRTDRNVLERQDGGALSACQTLSENSLARESVAGGNSHSMYLNEETPIALGRHIWVFCYMN